MSTFNQSAISRLSREIADLQKSDAREAAKESGLVSKAKRAELDAAKARNISAAQSKIRDLERAMKDLASVRKKRADLTSKIADRSKKLRDCEEKELKASQAAQRKLATDQRRLIEERERFQSRIMRDARQARPVSSVQYDFFVSHASEDKEGFVRCLAQALHERGAKVWYDEFALKVGDSLRESIDRGLANTRYGIVVLSEHFFKKEWTTKEFNALMALEIEGQARILPIWHKVSKDEVARYSPMIIDKFALNTAVENVDEIAAKLFELL